MKTLYSRPRVARPLQINVFVWSVTERRAKALRNAPPTPSRFAYRGAIRIVVFTVSGGICDETCRRRSYTTTLEHGGNQQVTARYHDHIARRITVLITRYRPRRISLRLSRIVCFYADDVGLERPFCFLLFLILQTRLRGPSS